MRGDARAFLCADLAGKPVGSAIDDVDFLLALRGAAFEVAAEHGPFMPMGGAVVADGDDRGDVVDDSAD